MVVFSSVKFTVFIRIWQCLTPQVWNWHFGKQLFYSTISYSNVQHLGSAMMVSIRSYVGYIESCKRDNTAVFIDQYFQYCVPEDFPFGKGYNIRTSIYRKTFRNLKHFHKES